MIPIWTANQLSYTIVNTSRGSHSIIASVFYMQLQQGPVVQAVFSTRGHCPWLDSFLHHFLKKLVKSMLGFWASYPKGSALFTGWLYDWIFWWPLKDVTEGCMFLSGLPIHLKVSNLHSYAFNMVIPQKFWASYCSFCCDIYSYFITTLWKHA